MKNKIRLIDIVSIGSLSASIVHPREVFRRAVIEGAGSVIIGHNHPSGDTTPSREDIEITRRLKEGGDILGIKLLDHVIIGSNNNFYSFTDNHLIGG